MLRNGILLVTFVVAGLGLVLHAWPMVIWGVVIFVAMFIERWRYQHSDQGSTEEWQPTDEQFIDPETGKLTKVFYKPATGERRYVQVDEKL
jgi:hypothetical protein